MSKLSKNILEKIHDKHIKPLPKWLFILGHVAVWGLFVFSILIGSAAVSLGLHKLFVLNDWGLVSKLPGGHVGGFLLVLPYLWILILGLMIFGAFKLFGKTEKGYKVHPWLVVGISVCVSFVLGSILFASRSAEGMENFMRHHVKPYQEFQEFREKVWHAPEHGVLPGRIVKVERDVMVLLDDFSGKTWEVDVSDAHMPPKMKINIGDVVVAVGKKTGESEFKAEGLKPANILKDRLKKKLKH